LRRARRLAQLQRLAEEATAAELKIPLVIDNAAATEITGKNCNRYTFRLNTPVLVQSRCSRPTR
jgi:branched-chain amino acid transport system substrate-binding protein